jgi:hypothetical protein
VSLHVPTSFWFFLKNVDFHVPTYFCEFLYAKREAKAKTCECYILFFCATTVRSTWGLKEQMKMQNTFLWSFSNASIGK